MTAVQMLRVRETPRVRRKCPFCQEGIRKGQYVAMTGEGLAHWDCAGVEGQLEACPKCFIITSQCEC